MSYPTTLNDSTILKASNDWLEKAVIGLNLCPFAKAVHVKQQIRSVVCHAGSEAELLDVLKQELEYLAASDPVQLDTTLLIHPDVLNDFLEYNDFLDRADQILNRLGLSGILQIASFHPDYQFVGTEFDDITNYTNRAPYPMLHLLREASVTRAVAAFPDAAQIYDKNMVTLRQIDPETLTNYGFAVARRTLEMEKLEQDQEP